MPEPEWVGFIEGMNRLRRPVEVGQWMGVRFVESTRRPSLIEALARVPSPVSAGADGISPKCHACHAYWISEGEWHHHYCWWPPFVQARDSITRREKFIDYAVAERLVALEAEVTALRAALTVTPEEAGTLFAAAQLAAAMSDQPPIQNIQVLYREVGMNFLNMIRHRARLTPP